MALSIAQFTKLLKKHINSKFPELQTEFYVSKRKQYIYIWVLIDHSLLLLIMIK